MKISLFILLITLSGLQGCQVVSKVMLNKFTLNIKEPTEYNTRLESHNKIVKDLRKKDITNYKIVYSSSDYIEQTGDLEVFNTEAYIYNFKGQLPIYDSLNICETTTFKYYAFSKYGSKLDSVKWSEENKLAEITPYLEYIDSTKLNINFEKYDYVVLMDYTTFVKGPQNRRFRRLNKIPEFNGDNQNVLYLFNNKDLIINSYFYNYMKSESEKVEASN
ncbi:hypothetical protein [Brumimicrobium mesophilum]|uniref:hypothetical protein n=1 Tax=Brumimicrobium mesophilum TaxID=392717 RepID=UPI000D144E6F|nr:hypothetical protein [Brumimicrobium mesophilum]